MKVNLFCIMCTEPVVTELDKIKDLESFNDDEDGCSIGAYCPVCNEHTLHSTLP